MDGVIRFLFSNEVHLEYIEWRRGHVVNSPSRVTLTTTEVNVKCRVSEHTQTHVPAAHDLLVPGTTVG